MNIQLITAKGEQISPEAISDGLQRVVEMLANSEMKNSQAVCIYNILCSACHLLKRYETVSRETLLAVAVEENDDRLRRHINQLHKNALYHNLFVPQAAPDDIGI